MSNHLNMTEKEFLYSYDSSVYEHPSVAVDSSIFTIKDGSLSVLLVKRAEHPFIEKWSLIGGYVKMDLDEDLTSTAMRKLLEKTSLKCPYLEQVLTVGNAIRDPRGWTLVTTYFALLPWQKMNLQVGNGALEVQWFSVKKALEMDLAFDHKMLLEKSLERLRAKSLYTTLPINLMQGNFTLVELQAVYEAILDQPIQAKSFRRRMLGSEIIEETGKFRETSRRPAMTYRIRQGEEAHYFIRNLESIQL